MANNVFNAMNDAAGNDMYITGGSIMHSEYEQNMTPADQKAYENLVMDRLIMAYNRDPYKQNLDFKHWLGTLNPELYRERALKYEDIKAENNGRAKLVSMQDGPLLEDAGLLQSLAHLHTGRIEDLIEIAENIGTDELSPTQGGIPFRRPGGMPSQGPPQGPPVNGGVMEGGGDQGPF
tara:strand:+ start:81 stop:614 length:534 start_codon:yes stop_codon:yes gene_type:complete